MKIECKYGDRVGDLCERFHKVNEIVKQRRANEVIEQLEQMLKEYTVIIEQGERHSKRLLTDMLFDLGCAYEQDGNINKAIELYRRTIELKPKDDEALYNLGTNLTRIGRYDEAIPFLRRAVNLDPNNLNYRQNYDYVLRQGVLRQERRIVGARNPKAPIC